MYSVIQYLTQSDIYKPALIYLSWMTTHYIASNVYNQYCVNWSITGYLLSPFTVTSPVCKGLNWVVYESSNSLSSFFIFMGSHITLYLSQFKYKDKDN